MRRKSEMENWSRLVMVERGGERYESAGDVDGGHAGRGAVEPGGFAEAPETFGVHGYEMGWVVGGVSS
jgi:hypothetical protein